MIILFGYFLLIFLNSVKASLTIYSKVFEISSPTFPWILAAAQYFVALGLIEAQKARIDCYFLPTL